MLARQLQKHFKLESLLLTSGFFLAIIFSQNTTLEEFNELGRAVNEYIKSELFQKLGIVVAVLYAATPSFILIPNEAFTTPLIAGSTNPAQTSIVLWILMSLGGFAGDTSYYFIARHGTRLAKKLLRFSKTKVLNKEHKFHKYGNWIFIFSPTLPFVAEIPLAFAGITHMNYRAFAPYLLAGNFLRNFLGLMTLSIVGITKLF